MAGGDEPNLEPFFKVQAVKLLGCSEDDLKTWQFSKVSFLLGSCKDAGVFYTSSILSRKRMTHVAL